MVIFLRRLKVSLLCCFFFTTQSVMATDVTVTSFGATPDGQTLNTRSIQKAIDKCHNSGGGKVIFPAGNYLTGTIQIEDGVTLLLEKNAVILGSTNVEDYQNKDPFVDGLGVSVGWALIVAIDAKNIGIVGEGTINGQGEALKAAQILTDSRPEGKRWGRRPFLIRIVRCNGVTVRGVGLKYAAAWTSHYFQCRNVLIDSINIESHGVAHNDGIDIDGCQDMIIKNSKIYSGDDAVCFKTTSSKMACKNIKVTNMDLRSNQAGIKMGTESMAAFENILITDCYIHQTNNGGVKLLTVDGAHLKNVKISGIKMDAVKTPILIRLGSRLSVFRKDADTKQQTGSLENVLIENIQAKAADNAQLKPPTGILITGVPGHEINNLTLRNIEIKLLGGGTLENSRVKVPEAIDQYPEVKTFGPTIPAYGLWARHINGLRLDNIRFMTKTNDLRPAIICEEAQNVFINNIYLPKSEAVESMIRLENVKDVHVENVHSEGTADVFVLVKGKSSQGIKLDSNKVPGAGKQLFQDPNK